MGIFKTIMHRFTREEMSTWSSFRKTAYLLLPLLIYLLIHDLAEILLWGGIDVLMQAGGERVQNLFVQHAGTVQGIVNGLAILVGVVTIGSGVKQEVLCESDSPVSGQERIESGQEKGRKAQIKSEKEQRRWVNEANVTGYVFLAALAFLTSIGINILFYQLGIVESSESFQQVREAQYGVQFVVGLVLYGVISPLAEEAVFRGLIYNRMKRCFSYGIALAVSALLFGCYHGNLVQAVYGTLLGLLIAYVYEIFDSFAAPVLFHSVANISVYVMTYHKGLNTLGRVAALTVATVMLVAAAGILIYLKKANKAKQQR